MTYATVLAALADPTRRAIFEGLRDRPCSVARLAENHPVSRPAVSQHLKVLENSGLVTAEKRGQSRIYAVRPEGLDPLRSWLEAFWDDVLTAYGREVERQTGGRDA